MPFPVTLQSSHVTLLRLTHPSLAAPGEEGSTSTTALTVPADMSTPEAFTNVLAQVTAGKDTNLPGYSPTHLPPTPPFKRPHHIMKISPDQPPHSEDAYYPA